MFNINEKWVYKLIEVRMTKNSEQKSYYKCKLKWVLFL